MKAKYKYGDIVSFKVDNEKMQVILRQEPVMLKRQAEYEQLSLFS